MYNNKYFSILCGGAGRMESRRRRSAAGCCTSKAEVNKKI
jgi:hypothetical protein